MVKPPVNIEKYPVKDKKQAKPPAAPKTAQNFHKPEVAKPPMPVPAKKQEKVVDKAKELKEQRKKEREAMMADIKAKQKLRPPRSAKGPAPKMQQPEWNFDAGVSEELVEEKQMQKIVEESRPSTAVKNKQKQ